MKINSRIFKYKFYRKIITSYIILVVLTVAILSSTLFYFFSKSSAKEIDTNLKSMLTQMSYASNVVYNQVLTISNQLNMDNEIITYLNSPHNDKDYTKVVNYYIYNKLSKIQSMYPFISSIGIYNEENKINVDTKNIPVDKNLINQTSKKYMLFYPRQTAAAGMSGNNLLNLLTFILHPDFSLSSYKKSAIVINIDQQYILNTIISINKKPQDSTIFVMDSQGKILSHTDPAFFMKNFSTQGYVKSILKENKEEGSFTQNIENKKQLVTYVKANDLNWYFVSIRPYNKLISNIYRLRNSTLIIAILLIFVGAFVSLLISGIVYNPMKALIDRIGNINSLETPSKKLDEYQILLDSYSKSQQIEKSANSYMFSSSKVIKDTYLLNLIKGTINESLVSEEIIKKFEYELIGPYYCTIIFKIDNFTKFKEITPIKDQSLIRFAVSNIVRDLLENQYRNDCVITEEAGVVLLLQLTEDSFDDKITLILSEIQDILKRYFKFTASISIGDIAYSKKDIYLSYKSALEYIKYSLFYGYDCILDGKIVKKNLANVVKYPALTEKKLIESIQLGNKAALGKRIESFTKAIRNSSYYQAINYYNQLIISITRHFENSIDLTSEHNDSMNKIKNSETVEDINQIIQDFCIKICLLLEEKNNEKGSEKYKLIIDKVHQYVNNNYTNPALSLELVSDLVALSPGYLGKIFKSNTSLSFNEYLNTVRLEKAKELLSTTNEPSSKICEGVGIYNVTYFSTLFKKMYGLTPSQYREQFPMN